MPAEVVVPEAVGMEAELGVAAEAARGGNCAHVYVGLVEA